MTAALVTGTTATAPVARAERAAQAHAAAPATLNVFAGELRREGPGRKVGQLPGDIAAAGNFVVVRDDANGHVYQLDLQSGRETVVYGSGAALDQPDPRVVDGPQAVGLWAGAQVDVDATGTTWILLDVPHLLVSVDVTGRMSITDASGLGCQALAACVDLEVVGGSAYVAVPGQNVVKRLAQDGSVSVVAGNGAASHSGDGGLATGAGIRAPDDLAVDEAGNLYISEAGVYVRKVNQVGLISTVAGTGTPGDSGDGGPAVDAQIDVLGLTADAGGNLYLASRGDGVVRRVDATGTISRYAGMPHSVAGATGRVAFPTTPTGEGGPALDAGLDPLLDVAANSDGTLFVAQQQALILSGGFVRRVDANGDHSITTVAGNGTASYAGDGGHFSNASYSRDFPSLAVQINGGLVIGDDVDRAVRVISPQGRARTILGDGGCCLVRPKRARAPMFAFVAGVAVDGVGDVFAVDDSLGSGSGHVYERPIGGGFRIVAGGGPPDDATHDGDGGRASKAFLRPSGAVAVDAQGRVYIGDGCRVRVVQHGRIRTVVGSATRCRSAARAKQRASAPIGGVSALAIDNHNRLLVGEGGQFDLLSRPGRLVRVCRCSGTPVVDSRGQIFYVDNGEFRVDRASGTGVRLSGRGPQLNVDGQLSETGLIQPSGQALAPTGRLYVASAGQVWIIWGVAAPATTPSAPQHLRARKLPHQRLRVSWRPPVDTGASLPREYVLRLPGGREIHATGTSTARRVSVRGLRRDTALRVTVTAVNAAGAGATRALRVRL